MPKNITKKNEALLKQYLENKKQKVDSAGSRAESRENQNLSLQQKSSNEKKQH